MKKSTLLLLSFTLPLALAACNRDDDCPSWKQIFGNCTNSAGTSGGTGGGSNAGTSGGTGGGSNAGTSGGTGGGATAGTSGGTGGGNLQTAPSTTSAAASSTKVCSTYCNSNDAGCYNISKCETEKYSASSKTNKKDKN